MLSNALLVFLVFNFLTVLVVAYDAVVVIKASSELDIQALKDVQGTAAVYKVKGLAFYASKMYEGKYNPSGKYSNTEWNYMVLGKHFATNETKKAYLDKISSFDFVEAHSSIGLTVIPHLKAAELNKVIAEPPIGNLLKRPLARAPCSGCRCACDDITPEGVGADEKIFTITFVKYGDEEELEKYFRILFHKVFPSLGVKYAYSGFSHDEDFDGFAILDNGSKETWCEYALSQLAKDSNPLFVKSFEAMAALSAVAV